LLTHMQCKCESIEWVNCPSGRPAVWRNTCHKCQSFYPTAHKAGGVLSLPAPSGRAGGSNFVRAISQRLYIVGSSYLVCIITMGGSCAWRGWFVDLTFDLGTVTYRVKFLSGWFLSNRQWHQLDIGHAVLSYLIGVHRQVRPDLWPMTLEP